MIEWKLDSTEGYLVTGIGMDDLAVARLAEAENNSRENHEKFEATKRSRKIMQAAGLRDDLWGKKADLSGIDEKLAVSRSQYDTDERMRNLEYSLRKLSQETLETLALTLTRLSQEKVEQGNLLDQVKRETTNLERDLITYAGEKGSLQQQTKQDEAHERDVLAKLKLSLNRNLLGELSEKDIEKTRLELKKSQDNLQGEGQRQLEERTELEHKQLKADQELHWLQEAKSNESNVLYGLERELADYEQQEQEI